MDSGSLQVMLLLFDHSPSFLPSFFPPLSSVCTNYLPESNQEKFKRINWDIPADQSALSRHHFDDVQCYSDDFFSYICIKLLK